MNRSCLVLAMLGVYLAANAAYAAKAPPVIYYDDGPIVDDSFVLEGRSWPDPKHLTFSFRNYTGDMPPLQIETAVSNALAQWALACPNLGFAKVADNGLPHGDPAAAPPGAGQLRILFGPPAHGDVNFSASVLAHAFYPPPNGVSAAGDVHFNDDFTWALNGAAGGGSPYDLDTVMLHEVGHSLGLAHEPTLDAVMNPIYAGPRGLSPDDIAGIRALYCPGASGTAAPIDLIFLVDLTGSFTDDLPNVQGQLGALLMSIQSTFTDIHFGVASFRDFPFSPYGGMGDYVYRVDQTMTTSAAAVQSAIGGMAAGGGADFPEAQYEAIHQVLTGAGLDVEGNGVFTDPGDILATPIGLEPGRLPVIVLLTDADFHDRDSEPGYPCPGCTASGRSVVLSDIAAKKAKIFVLISATPPDVSGQQSGPEGSLSAISLDTAAQELAQVSGGGVFRVGMSSDSFSAAVTTALRQVQSALGGGVAVEVPALSMAGLVALLVSLAIAGWAILRRRRRGDPAAS